MTEGSSDSATAVRSLVPQDLPAVARLFTQAFRRRNTPSTDDLLRVLSDSYLDYPWYDPAISSKVFVDEAGDIRGFIGVHVQPMIHGERQITAAFSGSFAVDDPERYPLAGARLLRSFAKGPQDLSISQTANATALRMWQNMGHSHTTDYSLTWLRVFRPMAAGLATLAWRLPAARILSPLAKIADPILLRMAPEIWRPDLARVTRGPAFADVDRQSFQAALLDLSHLYPLRPDWDPATLDWVARQAAQKRMYGEPCYRVASGADGKPLAAYAYFRREGAIGWVMQAVSPAALSSRLIDDLFSNADAFGCAGLRGGAQPWLNNALMSRGVIFLSRTFYIVHARDKALLAPFSNASALASGLAGEGWMRLIGDRFED
ncbi:hypothetical protein [Rhizobium sp. SSA_523]|uniref:hypothetical protein n=1 Tax=Rhizobium sp. SSA_523 TaxID=2952477 RepID=UPI00209147D1|nr:hypothetical protein [Rhizobium sp. SSA_523]MCO5732573.1 hypothetical protein [Rhizobium sp. SSA_523]WKC23787.1 hypothetical protein QTJ18_23900 [Rhizobium sp. SSA_523]